MYCIFGKKENFTRIIMYLKINISINKISPRSSISTRKINYRDTLGK